MNEKATEIGTESRKSTILTLTSYHYSVLSQIHITIPCDVLPKAIAQTY